MIRRFEFQADQFAHNLKMSASLRSALTKLVKENLSFPIADPLYSAFNHTHPTLLERIRELKTKEEWHFKFQPAEFTFLCENINFAKI